MRGRRNAEQLRLPLAVGPTWTDVETLERLTEGALSLREYRRLATLFNLPSLAAAGWRRGPRYRWMVAADFPEATSVVEGADGAPVVTHTHPLVLLAEGDFVSGATPAAVLDGLAFQFDIDDFIEPHDDLIDFWRWPFPLYHATPAANAAGIRKHGLRPESATRGLRNRSVGLAVFTTEDLEQAKDGIYGDVVFEIDTDAMALAGYTPEVSREPDVVEGETVRLFAHLLGADEFIWEDENDPRTVIIHGPVAPRFLRVVE